MRCAEKLNNNQIGQDPAITLYNVHRHFFLNVVLRACCEYLLELSQTPGADSLHDPEPIIRKSEANIDFAWITHFIHDAGFHLLDFLQSVRGFDSHKLDLLWAEFFAPAHTSTAHKTQYVPMAIMRVFWGLALVPELSDIYHAIRAVPSGSHHGCGVGWDMLIERLNGAITNHVTTCVTIDQIREFIDNWPFLAKVEEHMRDYMYAEREDDHIRRRDVQSDVDALKVWFREVIGTTWAHATRANSNVHVTSGTERGRKPWVETRTCMERTGRDAPHAFIRRHVSALTGYFQWAY